MLTNRSVRAPRFPRPALRPLVLLAGLALAPACTTTSSMDLVPSPVSVEYQNLASVRIVASGTSRSFGIGPRKVGSTDLEQAVRTAVLEAGLFQEVALTDASDWLLEVSVERLVGSDPGLTMTAEAHLRWRLVNPSTQRVRWESTLSTEGEAEPEDSTEFSVRGRIATERALADNLAEGVRRLGNLVL